MKPPGRLVSLAGSPFIATLLFLFYAALALGWYQGRVPGLLAALAVLAAVRTLTAIGQVRRYKTWAADWRDMGAQGGTQSARVSKQAERKIRNTGRGWKLISFAALVVIVGVPAYVGYVKSQGNPLEDSSPLMQTLSLLWLAAFVCLCGALLVGFMRLIRRGRSPKAQGSLRKTKAEGGPDVVAWLVPRASSAASRAAAQQQLPEYTARLIGRGQGDAAG